MRTSAAKLAPVEFAEVPLYVVDAPLLGIGNTLGFAGAGLDLVYRDQIGARWNGRGACFALDLEQVQDFAAREEANHEQQRSRFIREALELALHEFAHVLSHDRPFIPEISQAVAQRMVEEVVTLPNAGQPDDNVPWLGHDARYLRTVAHLEHRASSLLGSQVHAYLLAGPVYGLSKGEAYRAAIADEPAKLAGEPFAEIKQIRPPQAFLGLWQADLQSWRERNAPLSAFQSYALEQGETIFPK